MKFMISALAAIFATSFLIALSGALMPGPLLSAAVNESSKRGFWAGPLLTSGHALLELALVVALLLGLAPILRLTAVFVFCALGGSLILLMMAWGMIRSIPTLSLRREATPGRINHPVVSGILMSMANPYWFIWWATIGLGYILYSQQFGFWGVACFFAGHISADLVWYSLVSAAIAGGRRFLTDRLYRGLIGILAAFLVGLAVYFAYAGIVKLRLLF